jgi:restriction system protein
MKNYYRIMLGAKSIYADKCYNDTFIGADFNIDWDLSKVLHENWREFNKEQIPLWLLNHPDKSKVAAGLACGFTWTVSKGILKGDIVLCPNGSGSYYVGEVISDYEFIKGDILPHRRRVKWYPNTIDRSLMSDALKNSTGSIGTVSNITKYADEIEKLLTGNVPSTIFSTDSNIESVSEFALEKHLEDFLVKNWNQTDLGKEFDIYQEDGELVGQQYPSDTGPIDILAISKDKKTLLVVELKKGRVSDTVVGQIQRYMGYVKDELAESNQVVKGIIIGSEDDNKIRRALSVTVNIEFYRYQVSFKLFPNSK